MDCLQAQQVISAALDRDPVTTDQLAEAKQHCRECPECARFIKGLAAVQRAGMPEPPAGLAERAAANARDVVGRERASRAAAEASAAAAAAAAAGAASAGATSDSAQSTGAPPASASVVTAFDAAAAKPKPPKQRTLWLSLGAAAAVLLVVAGLTAFWGARMLSQPAGSQKSATMGAGEIAAPSTAIPEATDQAAPNAGAPAANSVAFIELGGYAYSYQGASSESTAGLTAAGSTTTSLDTGQAPTSRPAYRSLTAGSIIVDGPSGGLAFSQVSTQYAGRTYALRTSAIPAFGTWPTLPADVATPAKPDGTPTFAADSSAGGVTVYRRAGGSSAQGIAYAPNTGPLAGNPNWTWWTPAQ